MNCELEFYHGFSWYRGEIVAVTEIEPASIGWTAHILTQYSGYAIAIDEETKNSFLASVQE